MLPPDPPRHPRLRATLHHKWLVGLFGALSLLTIVSITCIYAAYGADITSLADEALDRSATAIRGEITEVEPTLLQLSDSPFVSLQYRFIDLTGKVQAGQSLLRHTHFKPGDHCFVEYLHDDPQTNRLRGTTRQIQAPLLEITIRWILLPGIVLLLFWLQGVVRLRSMLTVGLATHAKVTELRRYRWIRPPQLCVDYEFLDQNGDRHRGGHWVARESALGKQCDQHPHRPPTVIYDEANPSRNHLVDSADFLD